MVENLLSACADRHLLRFTTARLPNRARTGGTIGSVARFASVAKSGEERSPDGVVYRVGLRPLDLSDKNLGFPPNLGPPTCVRVDTPGRSSHPARGFFRRK